MLYTICIFDNCYFLKVQCYNGILYIECYNVGLTNYKTMLFSLYLEIHQTMLKDPTCSAALKDWFRSLPQRNETEGNEEIDDDE